MGVNWGLVGDSVTEHNTVTNIGRLLRAAKDADMTVVRDATAGAKLPEGDGYQAALIDFRYVANGLWTTDDGVARIQAAA